MQLCKFTYIFLRNGLTYDPNFLVCALVTYVTSFSINVEVKGQHLCYYMHYTGYYTGKMLKDCTIVHFVCFLLGVGWLDEALNGSLGAKKVISQNI